MVNFQINQFHKKTMQLHQIIIISQNVTFLCLFPHQLQILINLQFLITIIILYQYLQTMPKTHPQSDNQGSLKAPNHKSQLEQLKQEAENVQASHMSTKYQEVRQLDQFMKQQDKRVRQQQNQETSLNALSSSNKSDDFKKKKINQYNFFKTHQFPEQYEQQEANVKQYKDKFVAKYYNFDKEKMQQMLYKKSKIDIDTLYNHQVSVILGYQKLESKAEDYYRLMPTTDYYDFQRIEYRMYISKFQVTMTVKVLNRQSGLKYSDKIGGGSYGLIYAFKEKNNKKAYCLKRIRFRYKLTEDDENNLYKNPRQKQKLIEDYKLQRPTQLKDYLRQIGAAKLLSAFGVGPKMFKIQGFDAVVYDDCVCFAMKKCQTLRDRCHEIQGWRQNMQDQSDNQYKNTERQIQKELQQIKSQISWKVALLHSMKIVHRDIKPANILYDSQIKQYLLCDFGMLYALKQMVLQKSLVKQPGGTFSFMPPKLQQYMKLPSQKQQKIRLEQCLFYNDYFSLVKTFENISIYLGEHQQKDGENFVYVQLDLSSDKISNVDRISRLKRVDKQLNFMKLVYEYQAMIIFKWQQRMQLLTKQEQQSQKKQMQRYFNKSRSIWKQKHMQDYQLMEKEQGLGILMNLNSQNSSNLLFRQQLLQQKKQHPLRSQIFNKLTNGQNTNKLQRLHKSIIKSTIRLYSSLLKYNAFYIIQKPIQAMFNQVFKIKSQKKYEVQYFKILQSIIKNSADDTGDIAKKTEELKQKYLNTDPQKVIQCLDDLASLATFKQNIPKLVKLAIDARLQKNKYFQEQTAIIYINASLNLLQNFCQKSFQTISQYCAKAQQILRILYQNFQMSRLYLKIKLIRYVNYINNGQFQEAEKYSQELLKSTRRQFGSQSGFYLDVVLNQVYLKRKKPEESKKLIKQLMSDKLHSFIPNYLRKTNFQSQFQKFLLDNLNAVFCGQMIEKYIQSMQKDEESIDLATGIQKINFFDQSWANTQISPLKIEMYLIFCQKFCYRKYYCKQIVQITKNLHLKLHPIFLKDQIQHCKNGDECNFLKIGTCKYVHKCFKLYNRNVQTLKNKSFDQYRQILKIHEKHEGFVNLCPNGYGCIKHKKGQCKKSHQLYQKFLPNKVQSKNQEKPKVKCQNGANCVFKKQKRCRYYHEEQSSKSKPCKNGSNCFYHLHGVCQFYHSPSR